MHRDIARSLNPKLDDVPLYSDDRDDNPSVDDDAFIKFAGEDEHGCKAGEADRLNGERVLRGIIHGIQRHDLFTDQRIAIHDDRSF